MKAEPVNCLYEHVFSQPLLYYCTSQSFYKAPGELFKIIIIIIIKSLKKYEKMSTIRFLFLGWKLGTDGTFHVP